MKKKLPFLLLLLSNVFAFGTPDSWLQRTSLPAQPRVGAVAFAKNGFGFVGTGLDSSGNLLSDFWKYDPANDSWSQAASFPGTPRKNAVAFVTDSFAYAGSGFDSAGLTKDFYEYDAQNNSWLRIQDLDSSGAVYPRRDAAAFSIGNKGYVVGGYDGTTFYSKETWEFYGSRDTMWKEKSLFPLPGRRWATAFSLNGHGYVGMGFNYSQEYFSDFWKYNNVTNTWSQIADYAGNKRGYAVSFVIDGFAFVGTGFDGALKADFYVYDELFNQWAPVSPYGGQPTSSAASFSINGKGYVLGGVDTLGYKNDLWEYTPDNTLGIENSPGKNGQDIRATPNPAHQWFRIENFNFEVKKGYELKLFDASGKFILSQFLSLAQKTVFVENLPAGLYYYAITAEPGKKALVTGKVILE